jgi:hypothetical protein
MPPLDKLEIITKYLTRDFRKVAQNEPGREGYRHFVDLRKTKFKLPVLLYHQGLYSNISKLVFVKVSKRSLRRIKKILRLVCAYPRHAKIYRIDFALDLPNVTALELSRHCLVKQAQKSAVFRSRTGFSSYPHLSKTRTILIYDKVLPDGGRRKITRLEIQLRGAGVPIREFQRIDDYAQIDVLKGVSFFKFRRMRSSLTALQRFAAIGMQSMISELGLQAARKIVTAGSWPHLQEKFFEPADESLTNIPGVMRDEIRFWLQGLRRFPRLAKHDEPTE